MRLNFFKPMRDLLTGNTVTGSFELPAHGVLVLDERASVPTAPVPE